MPEPVVEGFAKHTFESTGDVLEDHDPEVLPLPKERHPVTGEPKTLLWKRQVKQLLSMTERILEVRATTGGSDIIVASFTDSSFDLTEVAGRHKIEIADQASCAAGWNPLSSSGRQRFWHVHCTLAPKLINYSLHVAVQQWLSVSNPSELSATTFQVGSTSIAIVCERHALATQAGTLLYLGHCQAPRFMDIGDTTNFVGWIASAVDTHHGE